MVMIPRAIFAKSGYHIETEPEPNVAQWERSRKCLTIDPDLFDVDASKEAHLEGKREGCDKCPVIAECRRDRVLNNPGAAGLYAGMIFTEHVGEAPYDITEYHRTHKIGGKYRDGTSDEPRFEKGWSEERTCKAREIGCEETFTVTAQNHTKLFHDKACRIRYNRMIGPELADAS